MFDWFLLRVFILENCILQAIQLFLSFLSYGTRRFVQFVFLRSGRVSEGRSGEQWDTCVCVCVSAERVARRTRCDAAFLYLVVGTKDSSKRRFKTLCLIHRENVSIGLRVELQQHAGPR